jgi:hypothetical protein
VGLATQRKGVLYGPRDQKGIPVTWSPPCNYQPCLPSSLVGVISGGSPELMPCHVLRLKPLASRLSVLWYDGNKYVVWEGKDSSMSSLFTQVLSYWGT